MPILLHGASQTRFDYVITSFTVSPEVATEVRDLILKDTPHSVLKEQLIKRTAAFEQRRLQQLFHAEELGDHKQSQLLRRMQQLLGDRAGVTDGTFLRELFLQRLSSNVRMVLASTSASTRTGRTCRQDCRCSHTHHRSYNHPSSLPTAPHQDTTTIYIRTEVRELQSSVRTLSHQSRGRST